MAASFCSWVSVRSPGFFSSAHRAPFVRPWPTRRRGAGGAGSTCRGGPRRGRHRRASRNGTDRRTTAWGRALGGDRLEERRTQIQRDRLDAAGPHRAELVEEPVERLRVFCPSRPRSPSRGRGRRPTSSSGDACHEISSTPMRNSPSRRPGSSSVATTRSHPPHRPPRHPHQPVIDVLSIRVANHAIRRRSRGSGSRPDEQRGPPRPPPHGSGTKAGADSRHLDPPHPRSRCRHPRRARPGHRGKPGSCGPQCGQCSSRRRNTTVTTMRLTPNSTEVTFTPSRRRRRLNAVVTRTGP